MDSTLASSSADPASPTAAVPRKADGALMDQVVHGFKVIMDSILEEKDIDDWEEMHARMSKLSPGFAFDQILKDMGPTVFLLVKAERGMKKVSVKDSPLVASPPLLMSPNADRQVEHQVRTSFVNRLADHIAARIHPLGDVQVEGYEVTACHKYMGTTLMHLRVYVRELYPCE